MRSQSLAEASLAVATPFAVVTFPVLTFVLTPFAGFDVCLLLPLMQRFLFNCHVICLFLPFLFSV